MGWKNLCQEAHKQVNSPTLKESFHLLTVTLLSLLLPLSFLLIARLCCVNYILTVISNPSHPPPSLFLSFHFYTNPGVLYALVSAISIATLIHGLTGKITFASESLEPVYRPHLYIAWIVLCILQVSVCLGIEGSIASGITGCDFGTESCLISRVAFFLGLHEIMLLWFRTVVKPVVDDTVFGGGRPERWMHRVAMGLSVGCLWWWKLRDEVESLVVVAEAKKELSMTIEMADFLGWWFYYLTVTIGLVRVVKALICLGIVLICGRVRRNADQEIIPSHEDQNKV